MTMKLGSIRDLEGNKSVLMDRSATGPDPVYWVFSEISDSSSLKGPAPQDDKKVWANVTLITPGLYTSAGSTILTTSPLSAGGEFPKTFGHYHGTNVNETYFLVAGKGVLQLQSKFIENGQWIKIKVRKVYLIKADPGDEILITPEWGHSWSNVGDLPLISFDNWTLGHSPSDYEDIKALQGLAYYLTKDNGEIKTIPNPRYKDLPEPIWITAKEFAEKQSSNSL